MTIAARAHHAISVRRVGPRDYQARVGKDGDGEPFVRHLLVEGIERIGGDTHDLIDAQRMKLTDIRLDILELVPTRLAGESFLEIEQDGLAAQRSEIKRAPSSGWERDGWGL